MTKRPLIIVLNHDPIYLEVISSLLTNEGYTSLPLTDNQKALEIIKQRQPRLVIIELLVSDPDSGLHVLSIMRLDPVTTHIPVIIASRVTQLLRDNEQHLRSKGCELLQKPFDLEELLTMVDKHVSPRIITRALHTSLAGPV